MITGCTGFTVNNATNVLSGAFNATWIPPYAGAGTYHADAGPYGANSVNLAQTTSGANLLKMSENLVLNIAGSARSDSLKVRFFTIGLGGDTGMPPNITLLQRMANISPYTVAGEPVGLEVYAPSSAQLMAAFQLVASSIARLSN
jgi:hypothetical protein